MDNKPEIVICLGSSCFSRGNKALIKQIKTYLEEFNLNEKVSFRGAHCFENCQLGPNLKINNELYTKVDASKLHELLEKNIGHLK